MPRLSVLFAATSTCVALASPSLAQTEAMGTTPVVLCAGGAVPQLGEGIISNGSEPLRATAAQVPSTEGIAFAFTIADGAQDVRLEASAEGGGDPKLVLETPGGSAVAENDDGPFGLSSLIETRLEPGSYCLRVLPVASDSMVANVQVARADQPALVSDPQADSAIPACGPDTDALPLVETSVNAETAGKTLTRRLDPAPGLFRFEITEDMPLRIDAREVNGSDPILKLFAADGTVLSENDDTVGRSARMDFLPSLPAGQYCLGVSSLQPTGMIDLILEQVSAAQLAREAFDLAMIPPLSAPDHPVQEIDLTKQREVIFTSGPAATWLRFTLEEERLVDIRTFGSLTGLDLQLSLFQGMERIALVDDSEGIAPDARLVEVLLPGTYWLAVNDLRGGAMQRPAGLTFRLFAEVPRSITP